MEREDGWRAFRICGVLDFSLIGILAGITQILADRKIGLFFSLIGILAGITQILADRKIGLFAISTYNTDYVLTKEENYKNAVPALKEAGYTIKDRH